MTRFQWGLLLALGATLVAAWMAPPADAPDDLGVVVRASPMTGEPAPRTREAGSAAPATDRAVLSEAVREAQVLVIRSRSAQEDESLPGLFSSPGWQEAKERAAPAEPAQPGPQAAQPVVSAPAVPFTLMGQLKDGAGHFYFLRNGDQSFVVKPGDTLLDTYRFEGVEGDKLLLRYLPLNQIQTMDLGPSS